MHRPRARCFSLGAALGPALLAHGVSPGVSSVRPRVWGAVGASMARRVLGGFASSLPGPPSPRGAGV
eukprot:13798956-Alexandrium_andersonii.AAC.1